MSSKKSSTKKYTIYNIRKRHTARNSKRPINWKRYVWEGKLSKTPGGLTKTNLMKSKSGKIVSKKQHANGLRLYRQMKKHGKLAPAFK